MISAVFSAPNLAAAVSLVQELSAGGITPVQQALVFEALDSASVLALSAD
ncbi:MAG: hypothetical protein ACP5H2_04740 [Solirubrobacteraceae bacterium]